MARLVIDIPADGTLPSDELIPVGKYNAEISNVEQVAVKSGENTGKPMYRVTCKILEGDQKGRIATRNVMLYYGKDGKPLIGLAQLCSALGQPLPKPEEIRKAGGKLSVPDEAELIGKKVGIEISHRTFTDPATGNDRAVYDLNRFVPPLGGAAEAVTGRGKRVAL